MHRGVSWLLAELPRLEHDGVLSAEAAETRRFDATTSRARLTDYLEIEDVLLWSDNPANGFNGNTISLPFDRYYMSEASAPAAQERYTAAVRRNSESTAWLTVRVRNGAGVIEGLFIDGVPIEQLVGASRR